MKSLLERIHATQLILLSVAVVAVAAVLVLTQNNPTAGLNPVSVNMPAPKLTGDPWINTSGGKPINLASRKGKVTVVEFWTFACINCRHNLPSLCAMEQTVRQQRRRYHRRSYAGIDI